MTDYPALSIFDLDYTLVEVNSSFLFCRFLCRRGALPRSALLKSSLCYLRHHLFGMTIEEMHEELFLKVLRGRFFSSLQQHVREFVDEELSRYLCAPAVEALRLAQHLGHYTLILSSAPSFLLNAISSFFCVDEWRGTEYRIDEEKRFSSIASVVAGEEKAKYTREVAKRLGLSKEQTFAYSDSHLDLPFLLASGTPIGVNPDKKLRLECAHRKWRVIE